MQWRLEVLTRRPRLDSLQLTAMLLHYMRQLMRQYLAPCRRVRRILPCPKSNMRPEGEGSGIDCVCCVRGTRIRVHAHRAEIYAKAWLKKRPHRLG